MEQQDFLTDEIIDSPLSQQFKDNMRTTAVWARLGAIFSFINAAFSLYSSLRQGSFFMALIVAAINVTIAVYLFNFGNQTKRGFDNTDQGQLEEGLNSMRVYFKALTILLIVGMCLVFLIVIIMAITAATSSHSYY